MCLESTLTERGREGYRQGTIKGGILQNVKLPGMNVIFERNVIVGFAAVA